MQPVGFQLHLDVMEPLVGTAPYLVLFLGSCNQLHEPQWNNALDPLPGLFHVFVRGSMLIGPLVQLVQQLGTRMVSTTGTKRLSWYRIVLLDVPATFCPLLDHTLVPADQHVSESLRKVASFPIIWHPSVEIG